MTFWLPYPSASAIDSILEKDDFTLEELLDEEDIVQEVKAQQNRKLLLFISSQDVLNKLVDFLIVEVDPSTEYKRRVKDPFIACEILCSETWSIIEALYENEALLDKLYTFLSSETPLNAIQLGYVIRVNTLLLQKKPRETIDYLRKKNLIEKLLQNMDKSNYMEFLMKVISSDEDGSGGVGEVLSRHNFIRRLIERFNCDDMEIQEQVTQNFIDLINISANNASSPSSSVQLSAQLEDPEILKQFMSAILPRDESEAELSKLQNGLAIFIELLKRVIYSGQDLNTDQLDQVPTVIAIILNSLDDLLKILLHKEEASMIYTSLNEKILPLGFHRLKIMEFFVILMKIQCPAIANRIVEKGIVSVCLDFFFNYPWNNFLHSLIEQMVLIILEGESEDLKETLFTKARLHERIVEANEQNKAAILEPKGMRRGYMGHLMNISISLTNVVTFNDKIRKILESNERWTDFVNGDLAETKNLYKKPAPKQATYEPEEMILDQSLDVNVPTPQNYPTDFPDQFLVDESYEEPEISFDLEKQFDSLFDTDEPKLLIDDDDVDEDLYQTPNTGVLVK